MTDREKAIVMAYTGVTMLTGDKFSIFHEYIEDICGRPIYTHELADEKVSQEIKEKSRDDFIKLCQEETYACDCIRRQAVLDLIKSLSNANPSYWNRCDVIDRECLIDDVEQLPSVNPKEPKAGHWIEERNDYGEITHWHCSSCYDDSGFITTCKWDFCPNCGAKMEGQHEDT